MAAKDVVIAEDLQELYKMCVENSCASDFDNNVTKRLIERASAAEAQNEQWKTWGVVEIAIRNPNVASYIDHWESRTKQAEAQNVALREALRLACADAWPNQPHWPVLYEERAAENVQTAPKEQS